MKINEFKENYEEVIMRLHTALINWNESNKEFKKIKILKDNLNEKDKKTFQEYEKYKYYQGKFYSYLAMLEDFNSPLVPILKRLRGMKFIGNEVHETKIFLTEKYGHKKSTTLGKS